MFPLTPKTMYVERVTRLSCLTWFSSQRGLIHVPPDYNRIPSRKEENEKKTIHVQSVVFVVRNC